MWFHERCEKYHTELQVIVYCVDMITPRQEGEFLSGRWEGWWGISRGGCRFVSFFDGGGVVVLVGAEGDGEVLDFVLFADRFEEREKAPDLSDEPFAAVG